jgi:hypothetical protein
MIRPHVSSPSFCWHSQINAPAFFLTYAKVPMPDIPAGPFLNPVLVFQPEECGGKNFLSITEACAKPLYLLHFQSPHIGFLSLFKGITKSLAAPIARPGRPLRRGHLS